MKVSVFSCFNLSVQCMFSTVTASSPTGLTGGADDPISQEDHDLLERSTKKSKMSRDQPENVRDESPMEGVEQSENLNSFGDSVAKHGNKTEHNLSPKPGSYKESLTGKQTPDTEEADTVSDDENAESDDDPKCPVITLTKEEKKRLREP